MNHILAIAMHISYRAHLSLAVPSRAAPFLRSVCESCQIFPSCVPTILQLWRDTIFLHSVAGCFGFFTSSRNSSLYRFCPSFAFIALFVAAARQYAIMILNTASLFQILSTHPIYRHCALSCLILLEVHA